MFKLAADFLSLDFLCRPNQKNKPESKFNSLPISQIMKEGKVLAIILRREFNQEGIHFLTPDDFSGSSVCVMQWTGVIRDETLIETDITAIFVNCLRSGAN